MKKGENNMQTAHYRAIGKLKTSARDEYELIKQKKSRLSFSERQVIKNMFE